MKRIALLGLTCFTLFGCGEKKVTEDMLLGEWNCTVSTQKADSKKGKLQDFSDPEVGKYKYIFTQKDGKLFWSSSLFKEYLMPFNLEDIYKKTEYVVDDMQISHKIEYLSKDSFSITDIYNHR
ncbi:hypothetical protein GASC598P17_004220 [Gilliamella apis SCGC AB-598-P17]|nr:hypothetical protein GASC598P17_003490 [Gilliamella apis SCGC AB-598-P17]KES15407.1 hypothetical protein GASC598P17_004220 [Gilliamella apis SCGC AB-598-P17]